MKKLNSLLSSGKLYLGAACFVSSASGAVFGFLETAAAICLGIVAMILLGDSLRARRSHEFYE